MGKNVSGADIIMQLDDVVSSTTTGSRVVEAMHRYVTGDLAFLRPLDGWRERECERERERESGVFVVSSHLTLLKIK